MMADVRELKTSSVPCKKGGNKGSTVASIMNSLAAHISSSARKRPETGDERKALLSASARRSVAQVSA